MDAPPPERQLRLRPLALDSPSALHTDTCTPVRLAFQELGAAAHSHISGVLPISSDVPFRPFDIATFSTKPSSAFNALLQSLVCQKRVQASAYAHVVDVSSARQPTLQAMLLCLLQQTFGAHWKQLLRLVYFMLVSFSSERKAGQVEFSVVCAEFALWLFFCVHERWLATDYYLAAQHLSADDRSQFPLHDWPEFLIALRHFGDTRVWHRACADNIAAHLTEQFAAVEWSALRLVKESSMCGFVYTMLLVVWYALAAEGPPSFPSHAEWLHIAWNTSREKIGRNMWIILGSRGLTRVSVDRDLYAMLFNRHTKEKRAKRRHKPDELPARRLLAWKATRYLPATTGISQVAPEVAHDRRDVPSFLAGFMWRPTHRPIDFLPPQSPDERFEFGDLATVDPDELTMHRVFWQLAWCVPQDVVRVMSRGFASYLQARNAPASDVAKVLYGCGLHMVSAFAYRGITPLTVRGIIEYGNTIWRSLPLSRWAWRQAVHFQFDVPVLAEERLGWWTPSMMLWATHKAVRNWRLVEDGVLDWATWFRVYPVAHLDVDRDGMRQLVGEWRQRQHLPLAQRVHETFSVWDCAAPALIKMGLMYHVLLQLELVITETRRRNVRHMNALWQRSPGTESVIHRAWSHSMSCYESAERVRPEDVRRIVETCAAEPAHDAQLWLASTELHAESGWRVAVASTITQEPHYDGVPPPVRAESLPGLLLACGETGGIQLQRWTYPPDGADRLTDLVQSHEAEDWWRQEHSSFWGWVPELLNDLIFPRPSVLIESPAGELWDVEACNDDSFINHTIHTLVAIITQHIDQLLNRVDVRGDAGKTLAVCERISGHGSVDLTLLQRLYALCAVVPATRADTAPISSMRNLINVMAPPEPEVAVMQAVDFE